LSIHWQTLSLFATSGCSQRADLGELPEQQPPSIVHGIANSIAGFKKDAHDRTAYEFLGRSLLDETLTERDHIPEYHMTIDQGRDV